MTDDDVFVEFPRGGRYRAVPARYILPAAQEAPPRYARWLGPTPRTSCQGLYPRKKCEARRGCRFIVDRLGRQGCYPIERPGRVSHLVPPGETFLWRSDVGQSPCQGLDFEDCSDKSRRPRCTWVQRRPSKGGPYCRGPVDVTRGAARNVLFGQRGTGGAAGQFDGNDQFQQTRPARQPVLGESGTYRFDPETIPREVKEQWYEDAPLSEAEKKYCRCTLYVAAQNLWNTGDVQGRRAYAFCSPPIARLRGGRDPAALQSQLATSTGRGACTRYARFETMPTILLYAYVKLRQTTAKGSAYFPETAVPEFSEFVRDPDAYRDQLLELIEAYKASEEEDKGRMTR